MATKYITTKDTYAYSSISMSYPTTPAVVISLPEGSVVNVISTTSGGIGIIATNYLVLDDNTFIEASAAQPYTENTEMPIELKDFSIWNGVIITVVVLGLIYVVKKYSKKSK